MDDLYSLRARITGQSRSRYSARLDLPGVITFGDISLEAATRMNPLNYCTACSGLITTSSIRI